MASFYKWYPAAEDNIVPWNARYTYPGQAIPAVKTQPRINPKNGANFQPGNVIRLEFPAQGYLNPRNTTVSFDVVMNAGSGVEGGSTYGTRFQNNIQSLFNRVRLMYGSTPIEDIINYNVITRQLTEWTQNFLTDQSSVTEGIATWANVGLSTASSYNSEIFHARQFLVQGYDGNADGSGTNGAGYVPNVSGTINGVAGNFPLRRYTVQLNLGLFNQDKLIPIKFLASQLAIEITLEQPVNCIIALQASNFGNAPTVTPTYEVQNVVLQPEILEFDAAYDAMFLKGLKEGGVPIKFSTFHNFQFNMQNSTSMNLQIQERARSVKSIFAVQRLGALSGTFTANTYAGSSTGSLWAFDAHAGLFTSGNGATTGTLQQYQFRIGGRYYPASPVQTAIPSAQTITNGASEAMVELQKTLHTLGDYRLSNGINYTRWGVGVSEHPGYQATDGFTEVIGTNAGTLVANVTDTVNPLAGAGLFSSCFAMAVNLETTEGGEISGLNAEEQSDIILSATWSKAQTQGYIMDVFTYFDVMMIIRENNVVELIQ